MTNHSKNALKISNLCHSYTPGKPVLKNINLSVDQPGLVAIIGPSGTGKSTLLRCINRLVNPTSGAIHFDGADLTKLSGLALRQRRRHIGMVFQEYNLVERLSVMENVLSGRLGYMSAWQVWCRKYLPEHIGNAYDLLETVGLQDFARQRADALSGGQRQRVGIARAVMQNPYIMLADEPTSSLDPKTSVEIMELMETFSRRNSIPVLINMHDVSLAKRFAGRMIGMTGGEVVFDGSPAELTEDHLKQIYGGESWLD